jgi:hypothetical protein
VSSALVQGSGPYFLKKNSKGLFCSLLYQVYAVRKLGNFRYILIPEIINMFMTNMSDPVRAKHVLVFKLNLK